MRPRVICPESHLLIRAACGFDTERREEESSRMRLGENVPPSPPPIAAPGAGESGLRHPERLQIQSHQRHLRIRSCIIPVIFHPLPPPPHQVQLATWKLDGVP